ncbi:T9SS type B sorting domain-containing protein [Ulvibacterium sp.]|uniref:T9SS type B sorting domain-containing protein n=1 Tax=Ulvibacterium sp. TaxID=2665914 RepID=UPI003BA93461
MLLLCFKTARTQTFEKLNIPDLKGGYLGFSSFVDYNNDGYLDLFVTGVDFANRFNNAVFYENNGNLSFSESTITNIPRVIYSDYSWADFDNNGTLDLLYAGTTSGFPAEGITKIYRNMDNGCEFVEVPVSLPGITNGAVDWVDIDNDGLLDIFLVGNNVTNQTELIVYKNQGNDNFVQQPIPTINALPGGRENFTRSTAKWSDLDGDGLEDLLLSRSTELDFSFELYKNLGGFQFSKQNIGLPKLSYMAMEVGDINNDDRPDIVFTGSPNLVNLSGDGTGDFYVFTNNGNMDFTNTFTIPDEGVFYNDIELGDIDNDGFLDAVNYGTGPWGTYPEITKIYRNDQNGTFSEFAHTLPDCRFGGIEFGDFDNDDDTDILYFGRIETPSDTEITYIYENKLLNIELPSEILAKETCMCDNTVTFTLNNASDTVQWNFGDPATGVLNMSSNEKASHVFSNEGTYTISATYTKGTVTDTLTKEINLNGVPIITEPTDLTACRNNTSGYDFNSLKDIEILNGASLADFEVFYYGSYEDAEDDTYRLFMPYTLANNTETIYVRVQSTTDSQCFVLTDFQVVLENPPTAHPVENIAECDDNGDGRALFDLTLLEAVIVGNQTGTTVAYFDSLGSTIPSSTLNAYQNFELGKETITARVIHTQTGCFDEIPVTLIARLLPTANTPDVVFGCDEDNDGISEYFDISGVAEEVTGNQTGMEISYYDNYGTLLSNLSNPYTNTTPYEEIITVRITDNGTQCFTETTLVLKTSERPQVNPISDLFACDEGGGIASFDTSGLESELIGNQKGLKLTFSDEAGTILNDFVSNPFKNQTPFQQRISVRVENESNASCYSETSFNLIVNTLPTLNLEETYYLCDLEPSLELSVNLDFDSFLWSFETGSQISDTHQASIDQAGNYTLTVTKFINGINCEQTFSFSLIRSNLPKIIEVEYRDLSENNRIRIIADGDGDFEYSLDGITYFDNNVFEEVLGGTYTVHVRDKNGCGEDIAEVTLIDYPKFFTPNGDNVNDYWQILGSAEYPQALIVVYDRYGKMITQFAALEKGWDGLYNGTQMPSSDYWFKVNLGNGRIFNGHFALKR